MKERTIELIDCRARTSLAMTQGWRIRNDLRVWARKTEGWIGKRRTMRACEARDELNNLQIAALVPRSQ